MSTGSLQNWIGRTETLSEVISPGPARALAVTLDQDPSVFDSGTPLPPLWHWVCFPPLVPTAKLGPDGHPQRGDFLPPVSLERRMWAGGRVDFRGGLLIGERAIRTSEIVNVTEKESRAGRMVFITVAHRITADRGPALEEEQNIVYVALNRPAPAQPEAVDAETATWHEPATISPALLFRFSAVTFNAHRIHYDRPYATEVEGYPGLVVHGPLQAVLLMESARRQCPGRWPSQFTFRGIRPLYDFDRVRLLGRARPDGGHDLYAVNAEGRPGMTAAVDWQAD